MQKKLKIKKIRFKSEKSDLIKKSDLFDLKKT